jgi:putative transposase
LARYGRLIVRKFDGLLATSTRGSVTVNREVEELIVRMAEENQSWGLCGIARATANLLGEVSFLLYLRIEI